MLSALASTFITDPHTCMGSSSVRVSDKYPSIVRAFYASTIGLMTAGDIKSVHHGSNLQNLQSNVVGDCESCGMCNNSQWISVS